MPCTAFPGEAQPRKALCFLGPKFDGAGSVGTLGSIGMKSAAVAFFFSILLTVGCTTTIPKPVDLTAHLSEEDAEELHNLVEWADDVQVYALGDYVIIAPASNPGPRIHLLREGKLFILIDHNSLGLPKDRGVVLNFFKNERVFLTDLGSDVIISETMNEKINRNPRVNLSDFDGDGVYDRLSYSAFDQDGKLTVDVADFNLDGQPDLRTVYDDSKSKVYAWIGDRWQRVEKRGHKRCAFVGETCKFIKFKGDTWVFVE